MRRERLIVLAGSLAGTAAGWGLFAVLYPLLPAPAGLDGTAKRLMFALRADTPVAVVVFVLSIAIGLARFLGGAFDPLTQRDSRFVEVTARTLTNSVEQGLVFVIGSLALAGVLPADEMKAIPALAALFVLARIVFWAGYLAHPLYRAAGMALTYEVNLAVFAYLAYRLWG